MHLRILQIQIKHLVDRVMALILVLLVSPLLVSIALAVKLCDGGPVFFRQRRPGLNGRLFTIWKFRTMTVNADQHLDEQGRVTTGNRITPVGKYLRQWSIDELPQLFNILRGDMSIIGPRPISIEHLPKLTVEQRRRFAMLPGVTGLAQVNGRNTIKWSRRIEYDLQYVDSYSLRLDLLIILRTVRVVLLGDGLVLDRNPEFADDLDETAQRKQPINTKQAA